MLAKISSGRNFRISGVEGRAEPGLTKLLSRASLSLAAARLVGDGCAAIGRCSLDRGPHQRRRAHAASLEGWLFLACAGESLENREYSSSVAWAFLPAGNTDCRM